MIKKEEKNSVELKPLSIKTLKVDIVGVQPLIVHRFDDKCQTQMEEKREMKVKTYDERTPEEKMKGGINWFPDGIRSGFPSCGFKMSMVRAGKYIPGFSMTDLRTMFFVVGDDGTDLTEIFTNEPIELRRDIVRLPNKQPDIRYRAQYNNWYATLTIQYNSYVISEEVIINLIENAGFGCGIGEWRPEKCASGNFGLFKVKVKEL